MALAVGAALTAVSLFADDGACGLFRACSSRPPVGFLDAGDGEVAILTGPQSGADLVQLELLGPSSGAATERPVAWRIERTGETSPAWDGSVLIGDVPAGFDETVPLTADEIGGLRVEVRSECGTGYAATVPSDGFDEGMVVTSDGGTDTITSFLDKDRGLPPCDPSPLASPGAQVGGLGLIVVGFAALGAAQWSRGREESPAR